jgi:hypothetical protein
MVLHDTAIILPPIVTMSDEISEAVKALLREHVTSFEKLELLLLLSGEPQQAWTIASLSSRVRVLEDLIVEALDALQRSRLVTSAVECGQRVARYAPATAELANAARELFRIFPEQRAAIIVFMNANAIERVRSGAIRTFADAFIIRKEGKDG